MKPQTDKPLLTAEDGWNRTFSHPNKGFQTEFIERALSDNPRSEEEIAQIANLIYLRENQSGDPDFVKPATVHKHLTYHHKTLGASKREKRKDEKLRMPELIESKGRWCMPPEMRTRQELTEVTEDSNSNDGDSKGGTGAEAGPVPPPKTGDASWRRRVLAWLGENVQKVLITVISGLLVALVLAWLGLSK